MKMIKDNPILTYGLICIIASILVFFIGLSIELTKGEEIRYNQYCDFVSDFYCVGENKTYEEFTDCKKNYIPRCIDYQHST